MDGSLPTLKAPIDVDLRPAVDRILHVQDAAGAIAWFENGPWDPWNHVESAMALCAMGEAAAAATAYDYLATQQRADGGWFGEYGNALPMVDRDFISRDRAPAFLDSNFCAYPAVGIAHYHAVTGDISRVSAWWPMVKRALDFVLTLQRADGTFCWAKEALGTDEEDALLAGNASILKSLECGLYLAKAVTAAQPDWAQAHAALLCALRDHPERFDRRGAGARFAMDWYYPVLAGALPHARAHQRIKDGWPQFVINARGCRCVSDEPWVTIAETAELVLALVSIGETAQAAKLFAALSEYRDEAGVFWMGWQTREQIVWPREQPSWTQAAVILAADALNRTSAGYQVLTNPLR